MTREMFPFASVVIPVRDDSARLRLCLRALEEQRYPTDAFEVIVVDNGSKCPPADVVAEFGHASLVVEPAPGSYRARNTGLRRARGPVIAFTDSDCIPAPDWLARGVSRLLSVKPECGLVAGAVRLFFHDADRLTAAELYEKVFAFRQELYATSYRFGATANVFTTRAVIDAVGAFDDRMESGGDAEWGHRVADAGYTLVYADDAVVSHPARSSLRQICGKTIRVIRGAAHLRRGFWTALGLFVASTLEPFWIVAVRPEIRQLSRLSHRLRVAAVVFLVSYTKAATWLLNACHAGLLHGKAR